MSRHLESMACRGHYGADGRFVVDHRQSKCGQPIDLGAPVNVGETDCAECAEQAGLERREIKTASEGT